MIYLNLIFLFLLWIISGLSRSLVHAILHHYKEFDEKFDSGDFWFNPNISWRNKYLVKWTIKIFSFVRIVFPVPVQFSDAFHFFNTIELISDHIREAIYVGIISDLLFPDLSGWEIFFISSGALLVSGGVKIFIAFNVGYNKIWK